ncbi:acyltransferase family protein [Micromonospora arborensis]|uniref:acyltransferase family protein n=1 Tax=Micromonospora arborensis TaxID=2116518 RepID=UPI0037157B1A
MSVTSLDAAARGATEEAGAPALSKSVKSRQGERLYVLDLLRFVAAIIVLVYHLMPVATQAYASYIFGVPAFHYSRYGWLGVDLFFLISGFVICMSSWGRGTGQFITSRITRLMPAYWVAVPIALMFRTLWPENPDDPAPPLSDALANLTMTQGLRGIADLDGVYWTLLVELKFYLIFAAVVWFGLSYRRVITFCLLWTALAIFAQHSQQQLLIALLEPKYTSHFVAGITLYLIYRFGPNLFLWGMLAVSWIFCVLSVKNIVGERVAAGENLTLKTGALVITVFYLIMIGVALGWFSWIRWRGLVLVGSLTYPVYLLHNTIGPVAIRRLNDSVPRWLLMIGVFTGIMLAGYLVHRFVERPGAKMLRRGLVRSFDQIRDGSRLSARPDPAGDVRSPATVPTEVTSVGTGRVEPMAADVSPIGTPAGTSASAPSALGGPAQSKSALDAPTVALPTLTSSKGTQ